MDLDLADFRDLLWRRSYRVRRLEGFGEEMLEREIELEEYITHDMALRPQILALILRHAQIR